MKDVLPLLERTTRILGDIVDFLAPKVYDCDLFSCEISTDEESKEFVNCILKKFISGLLNNKSIYRNDSIVAAVKEPVLNKNRRMLTLRQ